MKRLLYLGAIYFFAASLFSSCEKETTKGLSTLRYYPAITLQGDAVITINEGDSYVDPGATAEQNGVALDVVTTVTSRYFGYSGSTIDNTQPDDYLINYTATNDEGYSATASRVVTVRPHQGDFVTTIDGVYTANVSRTPAQGTVDPNADLGPIMVIRVSGNTYVMTDGIGGYYVFGRDIGYSYLAPGATFTADMVNNVGIPGPAYTVNTFGGVVNMTNIVIDPVNKRITFSAIWDAGYTFNVVMTQIQN